MKSNEWHNRGLEATDPIDAMTNFWRAFNNQYSPTPGKNERTKIANFIKSKITEQQAQNLIGLRAAEIEYLVSQPIVDMRGNGQDTNRDIETYRRLKEPVERLISLFMIIYQVRCNLEHGQKSPSRERDIDLCRCSAAIVSSVNSDISQETA